MFTFHTKLADISLASSLLATTRESASVNSNNLVLIQFLSKVGAQYSETMNPYRITSYTKVRERIGIS
jgi:hypothetical protein